METMYSRTEGLIGKEGVERLKAASVLVVGVGGVGGYAVEALARAGVGRICVVDSDKVAPSNLNRQIIATQKTVGMAKVDAIMQRILDINPDCKVTAHEIFFTKECAPVLNFSEYDYILDCIDSVKSKIELIRLAKEAGTPIISAMGAGNKLDPTRFRITDISKTYEDPLAKVVRVELRKLGINHLKVVFSDEPPVRCGERTPMSISFIPSVMGLIMAGEVIGEIAKVGDA